jgi:uncharacterized protein (DUF433 family)
MKIAKQIGPWQSPHEHHESRRRHAKLAGWPDAKLHIAAAGEPQEKSDVCTYSDALLWAFEKATARCPGITVDKDIMQGQPCVLGTRIPVRSVLRVLENNASADAVKVSYPHLTTQQVEDVLYFSQILLELPSGIDETAPIA